MKLDVAQAAAPAAAQNPLPRASAEIGPLPEGSDFAAKVKADDAPVPAQPAGVPITGGGLEAALDPAKIFGQIRAWFDAAEAPQRELRTQLEKNKVPFDDPRWQEVNKVSGRLLLDMQMEVHAAAARIEMFGKLVEHTTSSVRTVTQTQI